MRLSRGAVVLLAVCQVLVLVAGAGLAAGRFVTGPLDDDGDYVLLALGSDQGPPRGGNVLQGRADAIHLVVIPADRSQVTILSFPRDTYVPVPGLGRRKINAALTRGPGTAVATVENVTGIEVDDWAVTGFAGLANAVDQLGGLRIEVQYPLHDPFSGTNLDPGVHSLTGGHVLAFSRDRKSRPGGDLARSAAQGQVLAALHRQILERDMSASRVFDLAAIFRRYTVSSISTARLFKLAGLAAGIDPGSVRRVAVPARVGTAGAASVVHLTGGAEALFRDLREDGRLRTRDD